MRRHHQPKISCHLVKRSRYTGNSEGRSVGIDCGSNGSRYIDLRVSQSESTIYPVHILSAVYREIHKNTISLSHVLPSSVFIRSKQA